MSCLILDLISIAYTLGEPNPDSLSTMRVRIRLSQSVKPQMSRAHEIKKGPIKKSQWVKCFSEIEASITVEKKREIGRIRFSFC